MWRVTVLLVAAWFALILAPNAAVALADVTGAGNVVAMEQPTATPNPTAPPGPNLNQEQPPDKSRQKLVIGVFAGALLTIVVIGRRVHNKRRREAEGATSK